MCNTDFRLLATNSYRLGLTPPRNPTKLIVLE